FRTSPRTGSVQNAGVRAPTRRNATRVGRMRMVCSVHSRPSDPHSRVPHSMATSTAPSLTETRRRVVLVDFDWEDADLIPELLAQPGISVRLVAGSNSEDAG